jgi:thymidine phosphorylase
MEVTFALGEQMLVLCGAARDAAAARAQLERGLSSGAALAKFRSVVEAQGGDPRVVDEPGRLPQAGLRRPLPSPRAGYVTKVDALGVALAALQLGAGRAKAEDRIDPAVGVGGLVKVGDRVESGGALCVIHASSEPALGEAAGILGGAITVGDAPPPRAALVDEVIG